MLQTTSLLDIRNAIRDHYLADEQEVLAYLIQGANLPETQRQAMSKRAVDLINIVRNESTPSMMEKFLAEYGLTTKEGVALMCMAEALLRVPDSETIDALIQDKVVPGQWGQHLGKSASSLINSATWALLITGKIIAPVEQDQVSETIRSVVKRLGEPVVRIAVAQAMKELGKQFVLGRTISEASRNARKEEKRGYTYSYDMLGEAARTDKDAVRYLNAYFLAIKALAPSCVHKNIRQNPGISVKLSALHPRYEFTQKERVMVELVERTTQLAIQAKAANMGFNIDAEEADRLDISLDVIKAVLEKPELQGWDGFGVVVQAFSQRASFVIDWLYALSTELDRKIMVRLVKGAYWDAEIKRAQVMGLDGFPVFTRKASSDVSYIACAKKLLTMCDRIYPQFATHNAHSVAAILEMADDIESFEFQRLHGMGESLHDAVVSRKEAHCRIYAPVGAHQDLLAYLVRRLLENGANSSFVNQIVDKSISPESIAEDPIAKVVTLGDKLASKQIITASELFQPQRENSIGWDITDPQTMAKLSEDMGHFKQYQWISRPLIAGEAIGAKTTPVLNPANLSEQVGEVTSASPADVELAISSAKTGVSGWSGLSAGQRAAHIRKVGELYQQNAAELFALAQREAGKTLIDAIGEVREAVDFAYYYASQAELNENNGEARGVITCISPWNFPLAIFSGQVLASLAAGNTVIAKPADQTPLIAYRAIELMHDAGIPVDAVQLLPGSGLEVGVPLTTNSDISGVCFTGSTPTAQMINRNMAATMAPEAPLIAETGGLNAMLVDSTALPEQVVRDVLASAFQSAGQRCSALRMLYIQEDIADHLLEMLFGAMDELSITDPWQLSTDIGPVIDQLAKDKIERHCSSFAERGQVLKALGTPAEGMFVAPTVIRLNGIEELKEEIFGPVLHVATFKSHEIDSVINAINAQGYGLTFGVHSRVDSRVEDIVSKVKVGNIYVNRNQIGAVVGSQPFGGEGLSGTGPKAGGPMYVPRLMLTETPLRESVAGTETVDINVVQSAISSLENNKRSALTQAESERLKSVVSEKIRVLSDDSHPVQEMPGPTGELNQLSIAPRGIILCAGPDDGIAERQALLALSQGNSVVVISPNAEQIMHNWIGKNLPFVAVNGKLDALDLEKLQGFQAVACASDEDSMRAMRRSLANRDGALIPLISELNNVERFVIERHLCMDTTAAGGNASLIAASE